MLFESQMTGSKSVWMSYQVLFWLFVCLFVLLSLTQSLLIEPNQVFPAVYSPIPRAGF